MSRFQASRTRRDKIWRRRAIYDALERQRSWQARYPEHTFRGAAARGSLGAFLVAEELFKEVADQEDCLLDALLSGPSVLFRGFSDKCTS